MKKSKNAGIFYGFVVIILLFVYILVFNVDFTLNGEIIIELEVNQNYIEKGASAYVLGYDLSNDIKIKNKVLTDKIGTYKINYELTFLGRKYILERTVNVVDNIPPVIELNGSEIIELYVGEEYTEEGVVVYDNYDKDLNDLVDIKSDLDVDKIGDYKIIYTVKDSSGNSSSISRLVKINKMPIDILFKPVVDYIKNNKYNVSIGYYNLVTNEQFLYQENKMYYGASLIKTLDALYLYENKMVTDSIKPYIKKAISVSDNYSHAYLVKYIGRSNLKKYGVSLGAKNTLAGSDDFGSTTVMDQLVYLKKLYSFIQTEEELKSFFINDKLNFLKLENVVVMHKYGYWDKYFHDVGIVLDEQPYIVVILTTHANNRSRVISGLSNLIYECHKKYN